MKQGLLGLNCFLMSQKCFQRILAKYVKVSDAHFWFCQKTLEATNSSGSGRMNLCLGQFSITGTCRIQIYFPSELSDNSRPYDAPDEEEAHCWFLSELFLDSSLFFFSLPHLPSISRGTQSCAGYSPLTVSNNYLLQTKCIWC